MYGIIYHKIVGANLVHDVDIALAQVLLEVFQHHGLVLFLESGLVSGCKFERLFSE